MLGPGPQPLLVTVDDLVHPDSKRFPLARGVWMSVSDAAVELFVPRLFGDRPIVLRPDELAVCRPEEMPPPDTQLSQPPPREIALSHLQKGRDDTNLLLVLAQEKLFPPVRYRARFTFEGSVFHASRKRPHDGYYVLCPDRDRAIRLLTRHGVEETSTPLAWIAARRNWS
jgi:hypothetical protein